MGLKISANSIENINTAKLLQKKRNQFAGRQKRCPPLGPVRCLFDTPIHLLVHLPYKVGNYFFSLEALSHNYHFAKLIIVALLIDIFMLVRIQGHQLSIVLYLPLNKTCYCCATYGYIYACYITRTPVKHRAILTIKQDLLLLR